MNVQTSKISLYINILGSSRTSWCPTFLQQDSEEQDQNLIIARGKFFILHFRTSFRTTEVDYRLAAAITPRAKTYRRSIHMGFHILWFQLWLSLFLLYLKTENMTEVSNLVKSLIYNTSKPTARILFLQLLRSCP